jgi:sulfur-oxidizing protein SoxY
MSIKNVLSRKSALERRLFLKTLSAISGGIASFLFTSRVSANEFLSIPVSQILEELTLGTPLLESESLRLTLPDNAENGSEVPLHVAIFLPTIEQVFLLVDKNPFPLVLHAELDHEQQFELGLRIKMAESGWVRLIAKSEQKFFQTVKWVNVMRSGCGTG